MPNHVRFGAFELDPQSGELCSDDATGERAKSRVILPQQPLRLLLMLIEREGAMVTREEIQKNFWPNDTIVEFDHSINVAIGKLRRALGDSAENPKYIATIARRGYRLIVPVTLIAATQEVSDNVSPLVVKDPVVVGDPGFAGELPLTAVLTGQIVSHYRVLDIIGGGGMGVVYRAEDLKLGRRVAIKFLPDETASDALTLQRFEREAQTASSLNHPNICTIYEFGEHKGQPFLVMELLQGETLRDRLAAAEGPGLPLDELLEIALQISWGLQVAHQRGVIHRDIKPANIFLADHNVCKILDFGLAKMLERPEAETATYSIPRERQTNSFVEGTMSRVGLVMGTASYMSPEQAQAKEVDARTDLFSFGAVLYEMATGQLPFRAEGGTDVFDAILKSNPLPPARLNPKVPEALGRIIDRALEKDRALRYQSAAEMRSALQQLKRDSESGRAIASGSDASAGAPENGSQPAARVRSSTSEAAAAELRSGAQTSTTWLVGAAVVVALIVGGLYYRSNFLSNRAKPLTDKDTIVLAEFDNKTGDAVFDDTLKTALTVSLQQSPFLNVLPDGEVAKTLQEMTRPANAKLTPDVARELCLRADSKAYIAGSIASLGSEYVLGLKAVNCQSGYPLAQEQVTAASKEKVLDALGGAASKLRGELGESLATVQKLDVPLHEATTSSLPALKAFSQDQWELAIQLDPNFAMGYWGVGRIYFEHGELARANEYFTKAFQLRNHASERERLAISAGYYRFVTGELDKAAQTYQEEIASYPREQYSSFGGVYAEQGQYEKAAEIARKTITLSPSWGAAYSDLANYELALQRFDETTQIIHEEQAQKLDDPILHNALYALAFLGADSVGMAEQQRWYASQPEHENLGLALASDTEAYAGHLRKARELTERAMDSAIRANSKGNAAIWQAISAQREAAFGNTMEARKLAADSLKLDPANPGAESEAALALAMAGDTARAESRAQDLEKRFPLDTQMQSLWLPTIRAQLMLDRNNPAAALTTLQAASPIELGQIMFVINTSCLYHVYVRGQAYLANGQGSAAAAEFQKILDHSGIVWNCWTGAVAHLGVARANALQAKNSSGADADAARARALAAYKDFLARWKDADPDIPILKQAKAEYAKL